MAHRIEPVGESNMVDSSAVWKVWIVVASRNVSSVVRPDRLGDDSAFSNNGFLATIDWDHGDIHKSEAWRRPKNGEQALDQQQISL